MRQILAVLALIVLLQPPGFCACGASACCADDDDHCAASPAAHERHAHDAPDGAHGRHAPGCPAVTSGGTSVIVLRTCVAPAAVSPSASLTLCAVPPGTSSLQVTTLAEHFMRPVYLIVRALLI